MSCEEQIMSTDNEICEQVFAPSGGYVYTSVVCDSDFLS